MARFDKTTSINIEDININKDKTDKKMDELDDILDDCLSDEKTQKITIEKIEIKDDKENTEETTDDLEEELEALEDEDETDDLEEIEELKDEGLEAIVKNDFQENTIVDIKTPEEKKIGIASDHRGYKLKQKLTKYLDKKGYTVVDYGCDSKQSCDYPEFGFKLGQGVIKGEVEKGIAICGSGIGISIACNKIKGIRCAKVDNVKEVKYTRKDNDANVIAIAGNMPTFRAKDIIDTYLKTKFSGLDRHQKRIDMLNKRG